ncbi:glycosyltransferase family 2 protein [Vagococcus fluvialis]|uniref:glycosyltransferase family 2 protein n=1 Tax=Vagococcus fluvialis TaxID=2738 RepID=UPI003D13C3E7
MLTVIIPVFNGENYIESTVNSVLYQTTNCKILIINDGSEDKTHEICESLSLKNINIKYIRTENKGVSSARNLGIKMCETEYLSFLDADDSYEPKFVEKMLNKITESNSDVCYCGSNDVDQVNKKIKKMKFSSKNILENYLKNKTTPNTNSWIIRKRYLNERNLEFDNGNNFGEDMIFFSRLLISEPKIVFVNEPLTNYNIDIPNSLSKDSSNKIQSDFFWCERIKKIIEISNLSQKEKKKMISILYNYRLPVGILMSLKNNNLTRKEKQRLFNKYKKEIRIFNLTNGLRSVKGILIYFSFILEII